MKKCATSVAALGLGLIWVMACGGKSRTDYSSAGGAQNSAGSSSGAASASGGASGGSSSVAGGACTEPQVAGNCKGYVPSFWHNPNTGVCEPFVYGGCNGNDNRFATRDECYYQCGGGGDNDWAACGHDTDCVIASSGCCDACEPVQDQQLVAINRVYTYGNKYQNTQCPTGAACAPCPTATEYDGTRKYFKAVCSSGDCTVQDVRTSPLTECKSDADCVLRDGADCCEGCDGSGFVPVNKNANFCDSLGTACDACVSTGAEKYQSVCGGGGHCVFQLPLR